jgi:hypothetical protein
VKKIVNSVGSIEMDSETDKNGTADVKVEALEGQRYVGQVVREGE